MMTYKDLSMLAHTEAKRVVPHIANDVRQDMYYLSEAIHLMQQETNVVRRTATVTLNPLSTTGVYALADDVKNFVTVEHVPSNGTMGGEAIGIPFDTLERIKRASYPLGSMGSDGKQYYTINGQSIYFYPFSGVSGTLRMTYYPMMLPYSPTSPSGEWAAFGTDPESAMAANSPPLEFGSALMGIKDYLVAHLAFGTPLGDFSMSKFLASKIALMRDKPMLTKRLVVAPYNSPVR